MLQDKGAEVEIVEYMKTPVSRDELEHLITTLGIKPYDLLRKGEKIFKESYKDKSPDTYDWIGAMIEHPQLMERPIVVKGAKAVIGRPPELVLNL